MSHGDGYKQSVTVRQRQHGFMEEDAFREGLGGQYS